MGSQYVLPNGSEVLDPVDLTVYVSGQVPGLIPGLLLLVFLVISLFGYFSQRSRGSHGSLPKWLSIGGLITTLISFILYMIPGMINIEVIFVCLAVTVLSTFWYFLSDAIEE